MGIYMDIQSQIGRQNW